ncbi:MAG: hypothetical protein D6765_03465 [Bacteroidetes bacterium]|nr:MAG: hypothetical protein D6765_03465 [Bacteroidota bacterium]
MVCLQMLALNLSAQLKKTLHQTFEVGDSIREIQLELGGEVWARPWAGHNILTTSQVELYEASPAILEHFAVEERRYEIVADTLGTVLLLRHFDQERRPIRTRRGQCPEILHVKVYLPESFAPADSLALRWLRRPLQGTPDE